MNFVAYSKHVRSVRPYPKWTKKEQRRLLGFMLIETPDHLRNAAKAKIRLKYLSAKLGK